VANVALWPKFHVHTFTVNHRQSCPLQAPFVLLLNFLRLNKPSTDQLNGVAFKLIRDRVLPSGQIPNIGPDDVIIAPTNELVDQYNASQVRKFHDPSKIVTLKAHDTYQKMHLLSEADQKRLKQRLNNSSDLPSELPLAVGCPVMITRNQKYMNLANGDIGIVVEVSENKLVIETEIDGKLRRITVGREYERVRVGNSSIERHMYPVRVAYARTVHKTQGETIFGKLFIHVEGMETPGEAYVAFSRPTSLDNVTILPAGVNLTPEMFVPHVPQE